MSIDILIYNLQYAYDDDTHECWMRRATSSIYVNWNSFISIYDTFIAIIPYTRRPNATQNVHKYTHMYTTCRLCVVAVCRRWTRWYRASKCFFLMALLNELRALKISWQILWRRLKAHRICIIEQSSLFYTHRHLPVCIFCCCWFKWIVCKRYTHIHSQSTNQSNTNLKCRWGDTKENRTHVTETQRSSCLRRSVTYLCDRHHYANRI